MGEPYRDAQLLQEVHLSGSQRSVRGSVYIQVNVGTHFTLKRL